MPWTSVFDSLPDQGQECLLMCLAPDGSLREVVGYWLDGKWVIEGEQSSRGDWVVRSWMSFTVAPKIV